MAAPISAPTATDEVDAAYLAPETDETSLHQAWDTAGNPGLGVPASTADARERRRHVLFGLVGAAFVTVVLALISGGMMIALHVLVDIVLVGYVVLLVRHRQLAAERRSKIEPIRPPVNEVPPATIQVAPAYLLQSGTGS